MSDTPRTDAAMQRSDTAVAIEGCKLERELAEAKRSLSEAQRERDEWRRNFDVVNAKDHDAIAADRAVERALGRAEGAEYAGRLKVALADRSIFAEFSGPALTVIAFRCALCGSGAVPGEPIPHQSDCLLADVPQMGATRPGGVAGCPCCAADVNQKSRSTGLGIRPCESREESPTASSGPTITNPGGESSDGLVELMQTVAGVPCRFCHGPGNSEGRCPDCGKPRGE